MASSPNLPSKMIQKLIGKPVTLVTLIPNQPIVLNSTVTLFSGILKEEDESMVQLDLMDGTIGLYYKDKIIGFVENEVVEDSSSDIDKSERTDNGKEKIRS